RDCVFCHAPHGSAQPNLLRKPIGNLCADCHDASDSDFKKAHHGITPTPNDCLSCHTPHAAVTKKPIHAFAHEPFVQGSCDGCHDVSATGGGKLLADTGTKLCGECHEDQMKPWAKVVSPHDPVAKGDCLKCHLPHASEQKRLLAAPTRDLCIGCHQPIAVRAARSTSHAAATPGGTCTNCHLPHGGTTKPLFPSEVSQTCLRCHQLHTNFSHPFGAGVKDPKTQQPLTCLSCHDPHGTPYAFFLRGDPKRDLCVQCHKEYSR
ncbi:MAG: hypothetical protein HYR85_27385, partial [Planctomycetes bacterium]|nr:hypothetical protein [Planctomycetota bacterium]